MLRNYDNPLTEQELWEFGFDKKFNTVNEPYYEKIDCQFYLSDKYYAISHRYRDKISENELISINDLCQLYYKTEGRMLERFKSRS